MSLEQDLREARHLASLIADGKVGFASETLSFLRSLHYDLRCQQEQKEEEMKVLEGEVTKTLHSLR